MRAVTLGHDAIATNLRFADGELAELSRLIGLSGGAARILRPLSCSAVWRLTPRDPSV